MDKSQLLNQYAPDKETRQFFAQSLDKWSLAEQRNVFAYTGFFTQEEQADFSALLEKIPWAQGIWTGGFSGALRQICCFLPSWQADSGEGAEDLAPQALTCIRGKCYGEIGHRDVLGSLMGLGLDRRKLGDILVLENQCQLILLQETASLLLSQWDSVGRQKISLAEISLTEIEVPEQKTKEIHSTVASLRVDSMVATAFSFSRSKAVSLVTAGKVFVNHRECGKGDLLLKQGDLLSCRGFGNCLLAEVGGQSKKGRTVVRLLRYV